jgi:hypothetical protein
MTNTEHNPDLVGATFVWPDEDQLPKERNAGIITPGWHLAAVHEIKPVVVKDRAGQKPERVGLPAWTVRTTYAGPVEEWQGIYFPNVWMPIPTGDQAEQVIKEYGGMVKRTTVPFLRALGYGPGAQIQHSDLAGLVGMQIQVLLERQEPSNDYEEKMALVPLPNGDVVQKSEATEEQLSDFGGSSFVVRVNAFKPAGTQQL